MPSNEAYVTFPSTMKMRLFSPDQLILGISVNVDPKYVLLAASEVIGLDDIATVLVLQIYLKHFRPL